MIVYIDISNYVMTRAHTGIQRVVREFLFRLNRKKHDFIYKVVFFDNKINKFKIIDDKELDLFLQDSKNYKFKNLIEDITINDIVSNSIFFDMDGAWNNGLKRNYLYPILGANNVKIYNFIYDLVPIVLPQFSHIDTVRNFTTYLYAVYRYSDMVFFDSRSAEKDFLNVKFKIANTRNISSKVVKLGADIFITDSKISNNLLKKKYILFVGTIEPRKDQSLLLDAFEKLSQKHLDINLIFIGRPGWNNDQLIERIKKHPLLNKRIFWPENISDEELVQFYEHAYINVYLSKHEGFGLPILESLSYGNITIASKNSSMYEVGKNFADYLEYNSFNEIYEILDLYLTDVDLYNQKKEFIKKEFKPYKWDITYNSIIDVFDNIIKNLVIEKPNKLQFVFISIDVENLKGTIKSIDKYIHFVKEYIIVTRKDMMDDFEEIDSQYSIKVIDENTILGKYSTDFSKRDHVSKNWLLRASLINLDILDENFIMLDDDNRPIKKIDIEHFINDGKYNAYYFYDLLSWSNFQTDYDFGQHNMKNVLDGHGLELLSYSSHKPQIINKEIFKEVIDKYFEIGLEKPIDEWSVYFNYANSKYPFLFNKVKYDTLNWPGHPSNWKQEYIPDVYNFENFYASNFIGNYSDKIQNSQKIVEPYLKNFELEEINKKLYRNYNMVHGVLSFSKNQQKIIIFNIPYFLEAYKGSWLKLRLNYKMINCNNSNIEILYYINTKNGAKTKLISKNYYTEDIIEFGISSENLEAGEYDLLIDCVVDNSSIFGLESPYLVKLIVYDL